MFANRVKNLLAVPRQTARLLKRTLEEIADAVASNAKPQPAMNRVPVRPNGAPRFKNNAIIRHYSTTVVTRFAGPRVAVAQASTLTNGLRSQGCFRSARSVRFGSGGVFPLSLFNHLPNARARMFSTYAASNSLTAEAVRNLTTAIRTLFNASEKLGRMGNASSRSYVPYNPKKNTGVHTNISLAMPSALQTLAMARVETEETEAQGSYVEFTFKLQLTVPAVTLLDDLVMANIASDVSQYKRNVEAIVADLRRIKGYGSLPIEFDYPRSSLRVHFPNADKETVERLLHDHEVVNGVVYESPKGAVGVRVDRRCFQEEASSRSQAVGTSNRELPLTESTPLSSYFFSDVLSLAGSLESMTGSNESVSDYTRLSPSCNLFPERVSEPLVSASNDAIIGIGSQGSATYSLNEVLIRVSSSSWISACV